jgi:carbamoyltransferase
MDRLTGIPILLNTSLNIMGEPICETISELKEFFEQSVVDILVVENHVIKK